MNIVAREYRIYGRVQMVMYRDFASRKAKKLKLTGFVFNNKDGSVSVFAQGDSIFLRSYEEYLKKGSIFSRVDKVEGKDAPVNSALKSFDIIYN